MSLKKEREKKKEEALRGEIVNKRSKMGDLKPFLILLDTSNWINL